MTTADRTKADRPLVRVSRQALALAGRHAIEAGPHEIGGVLVGWWEGPSAAAVHELLLVADPSAGRNHYVREHAAAQETLRAYLEDISHPHVGYVGEWHSHPAPQLPSGIDCATVSSISIRSRRAVALLVLSVAHGDVTPHALTGTSGRWPRRRAVQQAAIERIDP